MHTTPHVVQSLPIIIPARGPFLIPSSDLELGAITSMTKTLTGNEHERTVLINIVQWSNFKCVH